MAGRKVFTSGEILTAADVNSFLMDQSVMVFADSTARSSAIPTPTEGMVTFREDQDVVEVYDGSAFKTVGPGKILQVVENTSSGEGNNGTNTFLSALSISITPERADSKIIVMASAYSRICTNSAASATQNLRIVDSADVPLEGAENSPNDIFIASKCNRRVLQLIGSDSPASTSEQTYKLQFNCSGAVTASQIRGDLNATRMLAIEVAV